MTGNLSITVEINSPRKGVNRRIAGGFARDYGGNIYLLHRGNVGGGRKGVDKSAFMSGYPGAILTVKDGHAASDVIILGQVGPNGFRSTLAAFVHVVHRFKSTPKAFGESTPGSFSPEFEGTKTIELVQRIELQCRHGVVVNFLQRLLDSRGYQTENTSEIDLRIRFGSRTAVIEVKSSDDTQSVYTAVGQLILSWASY